MKINLYCLAIILIIASIQIKAEYKGIKIGAIRWDGWVGSSSWVGREAERTLSPQRYHYRVPFFSQIIDTGKVLINGNRQDIMDKEIIYANYAGLDYWAFDYYPPGFYGMDYGKNLYMSSKYKNLIDYCYIMFPSMFNKNISIDQLVNEFRDPSYVKVKGNRPLLYFFFGYDNTIKVKDIEELRRKTLLAGLGTPYIVLMNEWKNYNAIDSLNMDAMSDYTHWAYGGASYSTIVQTDYYFWELTGWWKNKKLIPTVTSGWDKRCNYDAKTEFDYDTSYINQWGIMPTPDELANHIEFAVDVANGWGNIVDSKAIIIYAWNEHSEGGWLCPTLNQFEGTARIEAIRKKMGLSNNVFITDYSKELVICNDKDTAFIECNIHNDRDLPYEYIWYKDDSLLIRSKSNKLYFHNADSSINGFYKCRVVLLDLPEYIETPNNIPVRILKPLKINSQPNKITAFETDTISIKIVAEFDGKDIVESIKNQQAKLQWFKINDKREFIPLNESKKIIGAKSNQLIINNLANEDFGNYFLSITTSCDTLISDLIELNKQSIEIKILDNPKNLIECNGYSAIFEVYAETNIPTNLRYEWYKDSTKIMGSNKRITGSKSDKLQIKNLEPIDIGKYYCKVTVDGIDNYIFSNQAELQLKEQPEIKSQPSNINLIKGEDLKIQIHLNYNYDSLYKFLWYHNNQQIGEKNAILEKLSVNTSDSGIYKCKISNTCGMIFSKDIYVTVNNPNTIIENSLTDFVVNPNPASDYITINLSAINPLNINPTVNRRVDDLEEIKIYNSLGELAIIVETGRDLSLQRIDISHLPVGIYFLQIANLSEKFMVVR